MAAPLHSGPLYVLGRDAGAPVTVLNAVEAVAKSVKEEELGIGINAHYRVQMWGGPKVMEASSRVNGPGPLLWYDTGCHKVALKILKGEGEEERVLVIYGHRMEEFIDYLKDFKQPVRVEIWEVPAYSRDRLEERFHRMITFLRPKLAETGIRLVAHVGAERFLMRGLRTLGRGDLWGRASEYLAKYGLGAGPAYSAALAALIVIASDPSPERPTFLDVAKAFDVSMPSLKRRYMRLVEGSFA